MKTYEPSDLARQIMDYLDCPCQVFVPMKDDDPLIDAYRAAREEGRGAGFVPLLVKVDETLFECLTTNVDPASEMDFDREKVRAYRQKCLEADLPDAGEFFAYLIRQRQEECAEDEMDWEQDIIGAPGQGEALDRLCSQWNYASELTDETILAKIPVKQPWQIFAWLPLGGWNDCPDTLELMAAARDWQGRFGAVPAAVSHDEVEFLLEQPVPAAQALQAALEHYVFCPDRVDQCEEDGSVRKLADTLQQSTAWYFWWD